MRCVVRPSPFQMWTAVSREVRRLLLMADLRINLISLPFPHPLLTEECQSYFGKTLSRMGLNSPLSMPFVRLSYSEPQHELCGFCWSCENLSSSGVPQLVEYEPGASRGHDPERTCPQTKSARGKQSWEVESVRLGSNNMIWTPGSSHAWWISTPALFSMWTNTFSYLLCVAFHLQLCLN